MKNRILPFPNSSRDREPVVVASYYDRLRGVKVTNLPATAIEKAAAFEELRDALAAADRAEISAWEAEKRVVYFARCYLSGIS